MKLKISCALFLTMFAFQKLFAQTLPWSVRMADAATVNWAVGNPTQWTYEKALILKSVERVWERTHDSKYFTYIQNNINYYVSSTGAVPKFDPAQYNLDNINMGRSLLFLHTQTGLSKYKTAADKVRSQLVTHPRTNEGGFWHKQVYPYQMWLDGLYMAEPFYAEYSKLYHEENNFDDISNQLIWMENHARDPVTGLMYHGWDESKNQSWADPVTGCSPNFWGRALGWYAMSLVDVLDHFPVTHSKRDTLVNILKRLTVAIRKYQDPATGLWYQVLDKSDAPGNYPEASASCMFVYALAKGYRMGYLDKTCWDSALKGYEGILANFISVDAQNRPHLSSICRVGGLGGNPYRDGSYEYYIGEPIVSDDPKGVGPFILASVEIETGKETVTAIRKEKSNEELMYPNPVHATLKFSASLASSEVEYKIMNATGEIIFVGRGAEIDFEPYVPGLYFVQVITGKSIPLQKVIKE